MAAGQRVACPDANVLYGRSIFACAAARTRTAHAPFSRRRQPADKSELQKRMTEIAKRAELVHRGQHLVGVEKRSDSSYRGTIRLEPAKKHYRLQVYTDIEAAVVYDLARIVLLGPAYSYNFPPDTYTAEDIDDMSKDMNFRYRDDTQAVVSNRNQHPRLDYQLLSASKSADAAVAAAAAALATSSVRGKPRRGVRIEGNSCHVIVRERIESFSTIQDTLDIVGKDIHHSKTYQTLEEAAVAYDMMRQAIRRSAVNYPAQVSAAGVSAMKKWMDMNRLRLTGQPALSRRRRQRTTAASNNSTSS